MPRIVKIRQGRVLDPGEPELPSLIVQAGNLIGAGARVVRAVVKRETVRVPQEVESERRAVCAVCPKFRKSDGRCSKCGCGTSGYILDKLKYATEQCPDQPP